MVVIVSGNCFPQNAPKHSGIGFSRPVCQIWNLRESQLCFVPTYAENSPGYWSKDWQCPHCTKRSIALQYRRCPSRRDTAAWSSRYSCFELDWPNISTFDRPRLPCEVPWIIWWKHLTAYLGYFDHMTQSPVGWMTQRNCYRAYWMGKGAIYLTVGCIHWVSCWVSELTVQEETSAVHQTCDKNCLTSHRDPEDLKIELLKSMAIRPFLVGYKDPYWLLDPVQVHGLGGRSNPSTTNPS